MHEPVVDLTRYGVPLGHRQARLHRHVDLRTEPVSYPSRPNLRHVLHARDTASRVLDLLNCLRIYAVQQAGEDRLARLPYDHQDRRCDDEPYEGVGQRIAGATPP
jgi:hypothetical protein